MLESIICEWALQLFWLKMQQDANLFHMFSSLIMMLLDSSLCSRCYIKPGDFLQLEQYMTNPAVLTR